jgi:hypothetical protein
MTPNKVTIVPLQAVEDLTGLPQPLMDNLWIEDCGELLSPAHFSLWKEFLSTRDVETLKSFRKALVHRFHSDGHVGREEASSDHLVNDVFTALRLIKPTRMRFSRFQCRILEDGRLDLFSFTSPSEAPLQVPDSEALNRITDDDIYKLKRFLPPFLAMSKHGSSNLYRATYYYSTGYVGAQDLALQFISWFMGIEASLSSEDGPLRQTDLIQRIQDTIDPDQDIYADYPVPYLHLPSVTVRQVLPDLFRLRNELVHGGWTSQWITGITRPAITGGEKSYREILAEAAPFILRKLLVQLIEAYVETGA